MEQLKKELPQDTYESLMNVNITSLSLLMTATENYLVDVTHLDVNSVRDLMNLVSKLVVQRKLVAANEFASWKRVSSGCRTIDALMKGGVPAKAITELTGDSGVGKTQLCLQLSLMVQLPGKLHCGDETAAVYVCTEHPFPNKRLHQLVEIYCEKYNIFGANFEDNIFVEHIANYEKFEHFLNIRLPTLLRVKHVGIVVIDSIAGLFRSENVNVNYAVRRQQFTNIAVTLHKLADQNDFAVICTNQVTCDINHGTTVPCLGLAWSNQITYRCYINRFPKSQTREFSVIFGPDLPDKKKIKFKINKEGVTEI